MRRATQAIIVVWFVAKVYSPADGDSDLPDSGLSGESGAASLDSVSQKLLEERESELSAAKLELQLERELVQRLRGELAALQEASQGMQDRYTVTAEVDDKRLGIAHAGMPPNDVVVRSVAPGGWASRAGVTVGSKLLLMGQRDVVTMTREDFEEHLKNIRPLALTFVRKQEAADLAGEVSSLKVQLGAAQESAKELASVKLELSTTQENASQFGAEATRREEQLVAKVENLTGVLAEEQAKVENLTAVLAEEQAKVQNLTAVLAEEQTVTRASEQTQLNVEANCEGTNDTLVASGADCGGLSDELANAREALARVQDELEAAKAVSSVASPHCGALAFELEREKAAHDALRQQHSTSNSSAEDDTSEWNTMLETAKAQAREFWRAITDGHLEAAVRLEAKELWAFVAEGKSYRQGSLAVSTDALFFAFIFILSCCLCCCCRTGDSVE